MVLHGCVHQHNRLPEMLAVDWGLEFRSIYFEILLARYECNKATHPPAKPRFGSVVERLFGKAHTTFVYNLAENNPGDSIGQSASSYDLDSSSPVRSLALYGEKFVKGKPRIWKKSSYNPLHKYCVSNV